MNLLSLLILLASYSSSIMASRAPETISKSSQCQASAPDVSRIGPKRLQTLLSHIKTVNVIGVGEAKKLSGFHYYGQYKNSTIEDHKNYTIVKLSSELWIVIPAAYKQTEFHGGYVVYQGKNYGWKSFFPSSLTDEQLKRAIAETLSKAVCVKESSDGRGNLYTYESQDGKYTIRIFAYGFRGFFFIKTIYPDVQEFPISDIQKIVEDQQRQFAQARYTSPQITIDPIDTAIDADDFEAILQIIESVSFSEKTLQEVLRKLIGHRKANMVDLMLALGAQITQNNVERAFKASSESGRDYEVIATLLVGSLAEPFINETIVKAARNHPDPKVLQELIKWLVVHEKEALLASLPAEYKADIDGYKHELLESLQGDIAKKKQVQEEKEAKSVVKERKGLDKALLEWVTKKYAMPNSALLKKYFKDEQIIKFANKAIADNNDHIIKDLMNDDHYRSVLLQSNDLLRQALNRPNSDDLGGLFMDAYKKQFGVTFDSTMKEIIRTWVIKKEDPFTRAALNLIALFPEFAPQWLRANMQYFTDEQVLELLEKNPLLKDDYSIIQEIKRNKYQKSLKLIGEQQAAKQECAAAASPAQVVKADESKGEPDKEVRKLLAIIEKDPLLKRLYDRAHKYNKATIDHELKRRSLQLSRQKVSEEVKKSVIIQDLLAVVLKDENFLKEFWAHDAFQIMLNYENKDVIKVLIHNVQAHKKTLHDTLEIYLNNPENLQTIVQLQVTLKPSDFDTIFAGVDYYQKLYDQVEPLLRDKEYDSSIAILEKLYNQNINISIKNKSAIQLAVVKIISEAIALDEGDDEDDYKAAYEKFRQVEEMLQVDPTILATAKRYLGELLYYGDGVEKNDPAAYEKFSQAEAIGQALPGDVAKVKRYLGEMLRNQGNEAAAYEKFSQVETISQASFDVASAKRHLGEMLLEGNGVKKNEVAAYEKFSQVENISEASLFDLARAKRFLGQRLYLGKGGVRQNFKAAYEKFIEVENIPEADEFSLGIAKRYLGEMLYHGEGVDENNKAAYEKFQQTEELLENNDPEVFDRFALGDVKRYLGEMLYYGYGVDANEVAAYKKLKEAEFATNNQNLLAIIKKYLGQILYDGIGVKEDKKAAYEMFKYIEQQNLEFVDLVDLATAKRYLGVMLYDGLGGVAKNSSAACKKFREIIQMEQDEPGEVDQEDLDIAKKYLKESCQKNKETAIENVAATAPASSSKTNKPEVKESEQ